MLGKLVNTLVEGLADKWLKSESARRYVASLVIRWGQVGMALLLAKWATKYGISDGAQQAITGHWVAILELAAPAVGMAVIELASKARANLNAKTLEVAIEAPRNSVTPATAKAEAVIQLDVHAPTKPTRAGA
jgi:hypothetical protein